MDTANDTTFNIERWTALLNGQDCPLCEASDETLLLTTLTSGPVILTDDGNFPGYCILVYKKHVTELFELTIEERNELMEDVALLAEAVARRCEPAKINYAILGNEVPHLHVHIIPRYPDDGYWGKPIWSRPADARRTIPREEYEALKNDLRAAILAGMER